LGLHSGETTNQSNSKYTPLFKALIMTVLLALSSMAGATGALMSVIQHVQAPTPESHPDGLFGT
jgi:hypothetical protein